MTAEDNDTAIKLYLREIGISRKYYDRLKNT